MNLIWQTVKNNWRRFVFSAIAWTAFFVVLAWVDHVSSVRPWLISLVTKVGPEAWLGLGATILSTIGGAIASGQERRQKILLAAQEKNKEVIERNNQENIASIREIEDGLDALIVQLNRLDIIEEEHKRILEAFNQLQVDFTGLDEKQKQGDRLLYTLDLIADLVADVARLKAFHERSSLKDQPEDSSLDTD